MIDKIIIIIITIVIIIIAAIRIFFSRIRVYKFFESLSVNFIRQ